MTIDYQRRQLTIGRKMPEEPSDTELPLRLHRLAMVRGTVNEISRSISSSTPAAR